MYVHNLKTVFLEPEEYAIYVLLNLINDFVSLIWRPISSLKKLFYLQSHKIIYMLFNKVQSKVRGCEN